MQYNESSAFPANLFDADPNTCTRLQSRNGEDAAVRIDLQTWYNIDAVSVLMRKLIHK